MYYQRSSAFIGGLQSDRHRSPTTVWPQMNADKRRFARDLLRLSSYFLDTTLAPPRSTSPAHADASCAPLRPYGGLASAGPSTPSATAAPSPRSASANRRR